MVGAREVVGAAVIVVGLALFAYFGHPAAGVSNAPTSDWVASILVICAACVALLIFANRSSLSTKAALLGTVAGLLYGLSATLMKPVVESLHTDGLASVVAGWQFWIWGAAGVVGFLFQQLSLSTGRLVPSVGAVSVANPHRQRAARRARPAGAAREEPALACRRRGRGPLSGAARLRPDLVRARRAARCRGARGGDRSPAATCKLRLCS
jgi:hypothetical protein